MTQPIVILGAGYGGLTAARALGRSFRGDPEHPVILVDANGFQELKPKIPEAVGEWIDCAVRVPLEEILDPQSVTFVQAVVKGVDLAGRVVETEAGPLPYWRLVWALGGQPDFSPGGQTIPGLVETAIAPYSHGQACRLRHHLGALAQRAGSIPTSDNRRALLTVVVAGGGFVGAEMAGVLADRLALLASRYDLDPSETRVVLAEPKEALIGFDAVLGRAALAKLRSKGVDVRVGVGVREATPHHVLLTDNSILATHTLVWTAGLRGHRLAEMTEFVLDERGRIHTDASLHAIGLREVYVIGDGAHAPVLEPRPDLVNSAQAAVEEGAFVARAILSEVRGKTVPQYLPRSKGTVILLWHRTAVARVGPFAPLGWIAPWLKQVPTLEHLWNVGGPRLVAHHLNSTLLPLIAPRFVHRYALAGDAPTPVVPDRNSKRSAS